MPLLAASLILDALPASARTDERLGTQVVPTFQFVSLRIDADQTDYTGSTRIEIHVAETTDTFRLHAEEMTIVDIKLTGSVGSVPVRHAPGENAKLNIHADAPLAPGDYTLDIEFSNDFGTRALGLYRMEHEGQGYVFTQFEIDEAREAFPCWDEPSFKIEWQLALEVPEEHISITNTPVEGESVADGWRRVLYQRSKPMPSYLVAIAAGPLETVAIPGMDIPGNVVTVKGQSRLAQAAIDYTPRCLSALEEWFGSSYPYAKLDLIAIPEYAFGAMENPGAVTYTAGLLLIDPNAASVGQRRNLASVTMHELAHMWFGDLVTMEWWDDLWLNESFADWLADKVTHEVFPEFNVEVSELQGSLHVMVGDARPSAQAIRRPIESTKRVMENLGPQYSKGKAVLAMFEQWMGPETFRAGVLDYINRHAWGNATASDLWAALSRASDDDIAAAMGSFIEQPGVPLVNVELEGGNQIRVSQQRFTNWGIEQEEHTWKVPVVLRYSDGDATHTKSLLLDESSRVVSLDIPDKPAWVLPNSDQRGYYRWNVPADMLRVLATRSTELLSERERVGFVSNLAALLDAGAIAGDDYLVALSGFADDPRPMVVGSLLSGLAKVKVSFVPPGMEDPFAYFVRRTVTPAVERLGREARPGENEEIALVRPRLLSLLGDTGRDAVTLDYAEQLSRSYMEDPSSIDASLAGVSLQLAATRGDKELFDEYKSRFETTEIPAERWRYLGALGNFRDPELVEAAFQYALEGPLRSNELMSIPRGLMSHPPNRDLVLGWIMDNYDAITKRLPSVWLPFMPGLASGCSAERLATAQEFFSQPEHQVTGTDVTLEKVTDQVHDCVGLREREGDAVTAYLGRLVGER
jgi:alanyl aminopeptidase